MDCLRLLLTDDFTQFMENDKLFEDISNFFFGL